MGCDRKEGLAEQETLPRVARVLTSLYRERKHLSGNLEAQTSRTGVRLH